MSHLGSRLVQSLTDQGHHGAVAMYFYFPSCTVSFIPPRSLKGLIKAPLYQTQWVLSIHQPLSLPLPVYSIIFNFFNPWRVLSRSSGLFQH